VKSSEVRNDEASQLSHVPALLKATLDMDEAFQGFRHDLVEPFAKPETSSEHWKVWHAHESSCRSECEAAIRHWIAHRSRPELGDTAAYFLCRRFDEVSHFIQNLFLEDQTTAFAHPGLSVDEFLEWMLVVWWDEHGIREAYFHDLARYESEVA
jgi:hypothetical protein